MLKFLRKFNVKMKFFFKKVILNILTKLFSFFGFLLEEVSYSSWSSKIFILYKKKLKKPYGLIKNNYFNFEIYSQESDLRAVFNNNWDEESTRIFSLLSCSYLFEEFDYYDIGANYGLYSLPFLKLDNVQNHVIIEPNPFLTTCLEKTFSSSKVKLIEKAIYTDNQKKLFSVYPFASGGSNLENFNSKSSPLSNLKINVDCLSYAEVFTTNQNSKSAIIKIDIEGAEADLLKNGLLDYLSKLYKDFILMIEFVPKFLSKDQTDQFKNSLSNYYCIPLSNLNFIPSSLNDNLETNFFLNKNSLKKYYKINFNLGIEWCLKEQNLKYADIFIFSSEKLAKKAADLFNK